MNTTTPTARQSDAAQQLLAMLDTAASAESSEYTDAVVDTLNLTGHGHLVPTFLTALLNRAAERVGSSLDAVVANQVRLEVAR